MDIARSTLYHDYCIIIQCSLLQKASLSVEALWTSFVTYLEAQYLPGATYRAKIAFDWNAQSSKIQWSITLYWCYKAVVMANDPTTLGFWLNVIKWNLHVFSSCCFLPWKVLSLSGVRGERRYAISPNDLQPSILFHKCVHICGVLVCAVAKLCLTVLVCIQLYVIQILKKKNVFRIFSCEIPVAIISAQSLPVYLSISLREPAVAHLLTQMSFLCIYVTCFAQWRINAIPG